MSKLTIPGLSQAITSTSIVMDYLTFDPIYPTKRQVTLQAVYNIFAKAMIWNQIENPSVVFLDVDGVVYEADSKIDLSLKAKELFPDVKLLLGVHFHTAATYYLNATAVLNLANLVSKFNPIIVLSTNWGDYRSISLMQQIFVIHTDAFASQFADKIPDSYDEFYDEEIEKCRCRADRIKYFLKEHPTITRYAILDDLDDGLSTEFGAHFVHVDGNILLSQADIEKAAKALMPSTPLQTEKDRCNKKAKVDISSSVKLS